ncbi:MAG TPA: hypothetical protein VGR78_01600 [Verrucomicrobiae bacterium]|jgi:hypothetical protein|nr:hypothetical protein [Verrucomicrobiae bacterium]
MSAKLSKLEFDAGPEFEVTPRFRRGELEQRFAELKETLLCDLLENNQTLALEGRFELAANQAAGLAWTTEYPLLVFPVLFDEITRRERTREVRQRQIMALTEGLLEHAV